jgi:hypothetical protein
MHDGPLAGVNRVTAAVGVAVKVSLRLLLLALLTLGAIDTIAIVLLNAIYEPESLRHRHLWQPVLTRNLILAAPCMILLLALRARVDRGASSTAAGGLVTVVTRVLRIVCWCALVLIGMVEAAVLAGNLLFHQTVTLTRTPAQTLNLLYATLVAIGALTYLRRTRSARPADGDVPDQLRGVARRLVWHTFKRGAQFTAGFAAIFIVGALVFYKMTIEGSSFPSFLVAGHLLVFGAMYVVAGMACGAAAGGIQAAHERTDEIVRGSYALAEPLIRSLLQAAGAPQEQAGAAPPAVVAAPERARGLLARIVQWRLVRVLRGHWVLELLHDCAAHPAAHGSQSLEHLMKDRLIRGTADDIRTRLRLAQWVMFTIAVLLWWAPALLAFLRQPPPS